MQGEQDRRAQGGYVVAKKLPDKHPKQSRGQQVFDDAEEMPSPGRQGCQQVIQPYPEKKDGAIEAGRATHVLRPHKTCEVVPNMAGVLNPGICGEAVIIKDELKAERGTVHGKDDPSEESG
jgi:hypothetical protein